MNLRCYSCHWYYYRLSDSIE